MIDSRTIRSILPGKISRTVAIVAGRQKRDPMAVLKEFYASPIYAELENESSKLWWLSPWQLASEYLRGEESAAPR